LRDRGFLGATDALVLELAYTEDRVLVTGSTSRTS
jgi:hypothetical protein